MVRPSSSGPSPKSASGGRGVRKSMSGDRQQRSKAKSRTPQPKRARFEDEEIDSDDALGPDERRRTKATTPQGKRRTSTGDKNVRPDSSEDEEEDEKFVASRIRSSGGRGGQLLLSDMLGGDGGVFHDDDDDDDGGGSGEEVGDGDEQDGDSDADRELLRRTMAMDAPGGEDGEGSGSVRSQRRRKAASQLHTSEIGTESEFSAAPAGNAGGAFTSGLGASARSSMLGAGALTMADLLKPAAGDASHQRLKKSVLVLKTDAAAAALSEPLPEVHRKNLEREVAFEQVREDLRVWEPVVARNRQAEHLSFPLDRPAPDRPTNASLVEKFQASTSLEADLANLMQQYGVTDEALEQAEQTEMLLARGEDDPEEVRRRHAELVQQRRLIFYHELKARRINKIKSKSYRQMRKRQRERSELSLEELEELDPRAAEKKREELRLSQVRERMTQKHGALSKYLKRNQKRARYDLRSDKEAVSGMQSSRNLGKQLLRKMTDANEDDDEGDDYDEDDEDDEDRQENGGGTGNMSGTDPDDSDLNTDAESDEEVKQQLRARRDRAVAARVAKLEDQLRRGPAGVGPVSARSALEAAAEAAGARWGQQDDAGDGEGGQAAGAAAGQSKGKGGLMTLKFMQRGMEKQRVRAQEQVAAHEAELASSATTGPLVGLRQTKNSTSDDEDGGTQRRVSAALAADGAAGSLDAPRGRRRLQPGSAAAASAADEDGDDGEKEEKEKEEKDAAKDGPGNKAGQKKGTTTTGRKNNEDDAVATEGSVRFAAGSFQTVKVGLSRGSKATTSRPIKVAGADPLFPVVSFPEPPAPASRSDRSAEARPEVRTSGQHEDLVVLDDGGDEQEASAESQSREVGIDSESSSCEGGRDEENPWSFASGSANLRRAARTDPLTKQQNKKKVAAVEVLDPEQTLRVGGPRGKPKSGQSGGAATMLGGSSDEQRQMIERLFSGDGDAAESAFALEKQEEIEEGVPAAPEEREKRMPGWGSWGGIGVRLHPAAEAAEARRDRELREARAKRVAAAAAARADAGLKHVIISTRRDRKAAKLQVPSVPHPFKTVEQYERHLRSQIGPEWNAPSASAEMSRPAIRTAPGLLISPLTKDTARQVVHSAPKNKIDERIKRMPAWRDDKEAGGDGELNSRPPAAKRSRVH